MSSAGHTATPNLRAKRSPANPDNRKQRGAPDLSYNAAVLTGVLTYLDIPGVPVSFYFFCGTSAGSPQWASIVAIADQKAKRSLGFINATLYFV